MASPAVPVGPREWLDHELPKLVAELEGETPPSRPLRRADLLADDAAALRTYAARMRDEGTTAQAAATFVAGWFAGGAGRLVGAALGTVGAGLLLAPDEVVWNVSEEGWPVDGAIGEVTVLVPPGHPWAGQVGTATVSEAEMLVRTVGALIEFAQPLVEACKALGKVSRSSLWDEVADGIACALNYRPRPLEPAAIELLARAVELPGTPWKARPRLANVSSAALGPVYVCQKGGCCLAFTCKPHKNPDDEPDEVERAWQERFPGPDKGYCSTCKFRDAEDSFARQLFYLETEFADPATLG